MLLVGLSCFLIAIGVTWVATPAVARLARVFGAIDHPEARKAHTSPTPRIGGLAVFCGFAGGMVFAAYATGNLMGVPQADVYWRGLALAATLLMLVGLADDVWGLSFHWKFAAQTLAATYMWDCGFQISSISHPLGGTLEFGLLSYPITVLWIVGITNAVNLIDGLDGLATGIALITTITVGVIAFARGELGLTAASVALAGSLIGFLPFNFNPARIFLGDSGSMFLGFVLAVTSVRGSQKGPMVVALLVPLLVLGLPLLDTSVAVVRRLYRLGTHGVKSDDNSVVYVVRNLTQIFLPDRGHIHHRLLDIGMSHKRAVLILYAVGSSFAAAALGLVLLKSWWLAILLVAVLIVTMTAFVSLLYLRVARVERAGRPVPSGRSEGRPAAEPLVATSRGEARSRP